MPKTSAAVIAFVAALCTVAPARAHHSISGDYFMDQRSTIEGDLVKFEFRNPHSFVEIKGTDPATGQPVTWSVEWNGTSRLGRDGINQETLKPGDHLVITGQPGRVVGEHRLHLLSITRSGDGWKWTRGGKTY